MPVDTILGLVVSGLAALLGAWAGAAIAFRKFKQERTFDRRMEWLLEALRIVHQLDHEHNVSPLVRPTPEYHQARIAFSRMVDEAPVFMSEMSRMRLTTEDLKLTGAEYETGKLFNEHGDQIREDARNGEIGEEYHIVSEALKAERACILESEKVVRKALNRMMPPEVDYSAWARLRFRLRKIASLGKRLASLPRSSRAERP
jgi:hypothetical protein